MSGTILRGDDGSLYFVRDEVLAACKVEGEYLDHVNKMLGSEEAEVEGFSFNLTPAKPAQLQPLGYAQGDLVAGKAAQVRQAGDTIMCPW